MRDLTKASATELGCPALPARPGSFAYKSTLLFFLFNHNQRLDIMIAEVSYQIRDQDVIPKTADTKSFSTALDRMMRR